MKSLDRIITEAINSFLVNEINDIYNGNIQDEDCPFIDKVFQGGFTIRQMLEYDNAYDRIEYASKYLPSLGHGKRRAVFQLNDKYVLKLTQGNHRYQTKNEYDSTLLMSGQYDLFPRIIYQSRDFTWSIIEKAEVLTPQACESILGMPLYYVDNETPSLQGFENWAETNARQRSRQSNSKLSMYPSEKLEEYYRDLVKHNEWFKTLYKLENSQRADTEYGLDLSLGGYDFRRENLGVVQRNGHPWIVFIDAGFVKPYDTRKLASKHGIESPTIDDYFPED